MKALDVTNFKSYFFIVAILLLLVIILTFSFPNKTHAACPSVIVPGIPNPLSVPVNDQGNLVQNTAQSNYLSALYSKECFLDGIVSTLVKSIIRQITSSLVNWINSGFQGNPAFISNPEDFVAGIGDRAIGEFISQGSLGFLCDPFRLKIQASLRTQYGHLEDRGCTLSDVIDNVNGFIEGGDFRDGGWNNWLAISNRPGGNAYSQYLEANSRLNVQIVGQTGLNLRVADWGRGFLSSTDEDGNVKTPGTVIEGQLQNALGSDLRSLELADEIDEIVGALLGQLVQQVMNGLR